MLRFDKIKLVTNIEDVMIIDDSLFNITYRDNRISSLKFYQEVPYSMIIKIDYESSEAVIEFTGKILKSDYKQLISMETIRQCFHNINNMGFCEIDVEAVLEHGQVVKCDVTCDVSDIDVPQLSSYIRSNLSNYQHYQCRKLHNGNLIIEKNVTTRKSMKRITIYDKGKEMRKSSNVSFANEHGITGEFDGVCRLEMNLNSKEQIRNALNITDTNLMTVLTSDANPLLDYLNEVVSHTKDNICISDKKTYMAMLVLRDNDYDLAKVEAKMREFHPRGTSIGKVMEVYRSILAESSMSPDRNEYQNMIHQLSKCVKKPYVSV